MFKIGLATIEVCVFYASTSSAPFTDIKYDENKKAINKAYKLGITVGTSPTIFDPSRNITREELATMLCRGIKKYKFPERHIGRCLPVASVYRRPEQSGDRSLQYFVMHIYIC